MLVEPRFLDVRVAFSRSGLSQPFRVEVTTHVEGTQTKKLAWIISDPYADAEEMDEVQGMTRNQIYEMFSRMFFVQQELPLS